MITLKSQTTSAYDTSAKALAEKFDKLGARISDIEEVFALVQKTNPKVLEIGCGNGRDAQDIIKRTSNYKGIDISTELIKLAKEKVPSGDFVVSDAETYMFSDPVDIVFAFASLLHIPQESLFNVLQSIHQVLNKDGVLRMSLKYAESYKEYIQEDEFGTRVFYLYSDTDIVALSRGYKVIKNNIEEKSGQKWVETTLQKAF